METTEVRKPSVKPESEVVAPKPLWFTIMTYLLSISVPARVCVDKKVPIFSAELKPEDFAGFLEKIRHNIFDVDGVMRGSVSQSFEFLGKKIPSVIFTLARAFMGIILLYALPEFIVKFLMESITYDTFVSVFPFLIQMSNNYDNEYYLTIGYTLWGLFSNNVVNRKFVELYLYLQKMEKDDAEVSGQCVKDAVLFTKALVYLTKKGISFAILSNGTASKFIHKLMGENVEVFQPICDIHTMNSDFKADNNVPLLAKPGPDSYRFTMNDQVPAGNTLMVDDGYTNTKGAESVNMQSMYVPPSKNGISKHLRLFIFALANYHGYEFTQDELDEINTLMAETSTA